MSTINDLLALSDWYLAARLSEHLAACRGSRRQLPRPERQDQEVADRRLAKWRSQPPFERTSLFHRRLAIEGITEEEFRAHLALGSEAVARLFPSPPAWQSEFAVAFSRSGESAVDAIPWPQELREKPAEPGFLRLVEPLIQRARWRLRLGLAALRGNHRDVPFDAETVEPLLVGSLPAQLLSMVSRTLALELNINRLEKRLEGDTPEQRYLSFIAHLGARETALGLLRQYPVLARLLTVSVGQWLANELEFLERLCRDWETIRTTFCGGRAPGTLEEVESALSDPHRGGRSVRIARFSSGLRLVYKPKSLAVDRHFQELLGWLNERGLDPPHRQLRVCDRGGYGWAEYAAAEDCRSEPEVRRFYERQGSYLAVLYALNAVDFHYQNLIAAGEEPILVDLEALFHADLGAEESGGLDQLAGRLLTESVARIGLLPRPAWYHPDADEALDFSGLAAPGSPMAPREMPVAELARSDQMHFVRRRVAMSQGRHRPRLNGQEASVIDYRSDLLKGFGTTYNLLLRHRGKLLTADGPVARFADDEIRVILRPTRVYGVLLTESHHPRLLRNGLDRDRFFDHLWVDVEHRPALERVLPYELRDLWRNDVPFFTTRPSSRHLWASDGEYIPDFLPESGLEAVRRRLGRFGEKDLEQQLRFIRLSLETAAASAANEATLPGPARRAAPPSAAAAPDRGELLALARAAGERIEALAIRADSGATWLGLRHQPDGTLSLEPLTFELYMGLAGIALFLAYLGAVSGEERFRRLGREAWDHGQAQLPEARPYIRRIGAFMGWGSLIYPSLHVAGLWQEPALLAPTTEMIEDIGGLLEEDRSFDVIGGAAGAILCLLRLHRQRPTGRAREVAVQCGEWLLRHASPMARGIGWLSRTGVSKRPLTGLSHGAGGIAWALMELAAETGDERFRTAALRAVDYERSTFSSTTNEWADQRFYDQGGVPAPELLIRESFPAWCHGAAGIALSRLTIVDQLAGDEEVHDEIRTGVRLTLERGFGHNHSLCHGDLGNLDIVRQVAEVLGDEALRQRSRRVAAAVVESLRREGFQCGGLTGVEIPDLMSGLAGIGYGLLRLAAPEQVPSVLSLQPPAKVSGSP